MDHSKDPTKVRTMISFREMFETSTVEPRDLSHINSHRYVLDRVAKPVRSRSLPNLPEAVKSDMTFRPHMLCTSKQKADRNLSRRINRYPLESSRPNEPSYYGDCDRRMKHADRRKLHKALRQAKLPHRLLEFWRCHNDQHWNSPESILDAHMERIAHFNNEVMSHHPLSNFEDGELDDDEEDCRGYILLEETEMTMENHSLPQDLPSRECSSGVALNSSGSLKTQKLSPVPVNQFSDGGFNRPEKLMLPSKMEGSAHSSDLRLLTQTKDSHCLKRPPTAGEFVLN